MSGGQDEVTVVCPKCNKRASVPRARMNHVECPKCAVKLQPLEKDSRLHTATGIRKPSQSTHRDALSDSGKQAAPAPPSILTTVRPARQEKRLYRCFCEHWRKSRGSWVAPVVFAMIATPAASLLKPVLGYWGLVAVIGGLAVLALLAFAVYFIQRVLAYRFGEERNIPEDASSIVAFSAYVGMIVSFCSLFPLAGIEYFTPPNGLMMAILDRLPSEQPAESEAAKEPSRDGFIKTKGIILVDDNGKTRGKFYIDAKRGNQPFLLMFDGCRNSTRWDYAAFAYVLLSWQGLVASVGRARFARY